MKNVTIVILLMLIFCCVGEAQAEFSLDPNKNTLVREPIPMKAVPDYLMSVVYDEEGVYKPEVVSYSKDIDKAGMITVVKHLYDHPVWSRDRCFLYYSGTFLSDNDENLDKMCKQVPLVSRTVKYDRFEFLKYNADKYINYINKYTGSKFSVVKDRGKVIWYFEGEVPEDIAITNDGRYMIATACSVYFVKPAGERIVAEMYGGNRIYMIGTVWPDNVRILTDNIIRVSYSSGLVEHWQVRLSEEDVEKNLKKYETAEKHLADKCLLWSNGKGKPYKSQAMWCYDESDQEPVYDNTNLADITADLSDLHKSVSVSVPKKQTNEKAAAAASGNGMSDEAATGLFARLVAKVKGFFAGLFS